MADMNVQDAIIALQGQVAQANAANAQLLAAAQAQAQVNANLQAQINAAPAIAAPTFALSPAAIGAGAMIDYATANGAKIYKAAIEKLPTEYNLDRENLKVFLETLETRARDHGWTSSIMTVQQDGVAYYIPTSYGTLTRASIVAHVHAYAFREQRNAQNSANLYTCLKSSLSEAALKELLSSKVDYTVTARSVFQAPAVMPANVTADQETYDGVLLLWSIIQSSTAQTNATIGVIIERLSNLKQTMMEKDSNIKEFNAYVSDQKSAYYANKHQEYDDQVLLTQLFGAYKSCADVDFKQYIRRKEDDHNDGTTMLTSKILMDAAFKNYQTRVAQEEWRQETSEQKELVNLVAQIRYSSDKIKTLENRLKTPRKPREQPKKKRNGEKKGKKTPEQYRKERFDNAPAWMKKEPTDGKGTITRDGQTYHWCPHHHLFQKHLPDACRFKEQGAARTPTARKADSSEKLQLDGKLAQFAIAEELDYDMI